MRYTLLPLVIGIVGMFMVLEVTAEQDEHTGPGAVTFSHYGPLWQSDDGRIVIFAGDIGILIDGGDVTMFASPSPMQACGNLALSICGNGNVCCVRVRTDECRFECRDEEGHCSSRPCGDNPPDPGTVDSED